MKSKKAAAYILIILCVLYVLNPTAGIFELLPDNIPILGNIDEGLAVYLMLCSINYLRTGSFPLFEHLKKK